MKQERYISPILERIRKQPLEEDLTLACRYALDYAGQVDEMPVFPREESLALLRGFEEPLPRDPMAAADVVGSLNRYGSPTTVAQTGGRYFGFVIGGILPAALCGRWLADAWDQNPAMYVISPVASKIEEVCEQWLNQLLHLPQGTAAGFVSGSTTASICGLLAARNHLLQKQGWDCARDGLMGAPDIKVVLSEGAHSTIFKALSIAGLGYGRVHKVPMDEQGRIRADLLPELDENTLLILQAGNVNTGSFDDFAAIVPKAKEAGAWVHVDGAFGLWAAANPSMGHLVKGVDLADSWTMDAHKTLNAPYDNGIVLCRHREALVASMHMTGEYIVLSEQRDNMLYTMEMSRRARAVDIWATLKGLGSQGVAELVEELHAKTVYFARRLEQEGFTILNDVVFNQALLYHGDDDKTARLLAAVQESGVCWMGGSKWGGKSVIRISVCSYRTTYADIDRCVADIVRCAAGLG